MESHIVLIVTHLDVTYLKESVGTLTTIAFYGTIRKQTTALEN